MMSITDDTIRLLLDSKQIENLREDPDSWRLGTFGILKRQPSFNNGWTFPLQATSRFYKRWFDLPDLGARGWVIIFRIFDPVGEPTEPYEQFPGWVPPERGGDADRWIEFLNAQIRARLTGAVISGAKTGTVKQIDKYREFGHEGGPSILPLRGKGTWADKEKIVRYLARGKLMVGSPGLERDVFDPSRTAASLSIRTDGTYAWHDLLAYYVRNYDVALPPEFEEHMARNKYEVPEGIDARSLHFDDEERP